INQRGEIITPKDNMLHGITRKKILEAGKDKFQFIEGPVSVDDLYQAREAFLTGTTKKVLPIRQVDEQQIGAGHPGPVTRKVMDLFANLEADYVKQHSQS
ncbi:MAG: aminotransferase class IV, partial [Fulvivirga sp.]|nr:aminotransferase class IV [Fulvivirga sp.]